MGPKISLSLNRFGFFIVLAAIIVFIDLYTWQGVRFLIQEQSPRFQKIFRYSWWGITVLTLLTVLMFRGGHLDHIPPRFAMLLTAFFFIIYIAKVVFMLFLFTDDVLRFFRWGYRQLQPQKGSLGAAEAEGAISRYRFLVGTGAVMGGALFTGLHYGILRGAHQFKIFRRNISIKGLPESFRGLRILQLSDIHVGSFWDRSAVEKGIRMALDEKPDVIFFTGDLVNNISAEMDGWQDLFSQLKAPMGVYSILGNHDYGDYVKWDSFDAKVENLSRLHRIHRELGWDLLLDEHRVLKRGEDSIAVIGVQNWSKHKRFPRYGNLAKAYEGAEKHPVKILLSHDPSHWKGQVLEKYPDIHLQLSGHTHGFQFGVETGGFRWSPVKFMYPEWADLYEQDGRYLYVNRGFGYLGYPGRLGVRPEITVLTLT